MRPSSSQYSTDDQRGGAGRGGAGREGLPWLTLVTDRHEPSVL